MDTGAAAEGEVGEAKVVVIDVGSGTTKAGIAGFDCPTWVAPSIFEGERVMQRGRASSKESLEGMLRRTFSEGVGVPADEYALMCIERALTPKQEREQCTQIAFESLGCPLFYLAVSEFLSVVTTGRTTGVSVDLGYGLTTIAPAWEGYIMPHAVVRMEFGMEDVIGHLKLVFESKRLKLADDEETANASIREMITKHGMVSRDFNDDLQRVRKKQCALSGLRAASSSSQSCLNLLPPELIDRVSGILAAGSPEITRFVLPDGQVVELGEEGFQSGQLVLDPSLFQLSDEAQTAQLRLNPLLIPSIDGSILACANKIRQDLWWNVVLSGGNSVYQGLADRIVEGCNPPDHVGKAKVNATPDRKYKPWIGGSILGSLTSFEQMWITKQEFDESGAGIVHRKCF